MHVNRVVQQLRREGLIVWNGRRLTIVDMDQLTALAEFVPDYLYLETEAR